jgi:hypothetical protein
MSPQVGAPQPLNCRRVPEALLLGRGQPFKGASLVSLSLAYREWLLPDGRSGAVSDRPLPEAAFHPERVACGTLFILCRIEIILNR